MAKKQEEGNTVVLREIREGLATGETILEMKHIVKKFAGTNAVNDVSFSMKRVKSLRSSDRPVRERAHYFGALTDWRKSAEERFGCMEQPGWFSSILIFFRI